ncbi:MAG: SDR family NAD(P)-dependent oxidoreductase [Caulobacter sp.]|nr:SDR family NAD(P)-dependent oxidoreductase [Caulobacter sp.]
MSQDSGDLAGRVAVITGAASGIGLALATAAAQRGMKVALADIGEEKLEAAQASIEALGVETIAVRTDVASLEAVEALRDAAQALGDPWLVVNNAGITKIALTWDHTEADWRRMIDINIWGVVNGLLAFLPGLRARRSGHIVNTASAAGLLTIPAASAYVASKHAVVGLSETLYRELEAAETGVGLSVLCPALVKTNIMGSEITSTHAMAPEDVAGQVFDAVAARRFWILTHAAHMEPYIRARAEEIVDQADPSIASRDPDVAHTSSVLTGVDFGAH